MDEEATQVVATFSLLFAIAFHQKILIEKSTKSFYYINKHLTERYGETVSWELS
jgi:hypothetical protein